MIRLLLENMDNWDIQAVEDYAKNARKNELDILDDNRLEDAFRLEIEPYQKNNLRCG